MITAAMAPVWMAISKDLSVSVCGRRSRFEARIKCAVDDTGRNSVRPSTIPRMTAWIRVIGISESQRKD